MFACLLSVLCMVFVCEGTDCEGIPSNERILAEIDSVASITEGPYFACLAQGTKPNTYRDALVQVVLAYSGLSSLLFRGYGFQCAEGNEWLVSYYAYSNKSYISSNTRTDCESCTGNFNVDYCNPCSSACTNITGLMRCTGPTSNDCCVAFDNDICRDDLNCTNSTDVANEENGYICSSVCRENLLAGIVWKESYENDSITFKCSEISNKFSDSIFVTFSRECAGASHYWFAPSFASCTLSDTATNKPFIIVDVTLVADNTSIVLSKEAAILIEMNQLLADLADYDLEISITKYIEYTLGIGVVIEVTLNTYDHHSFTKTLQNFQETFYEFSGPIGGFQQAMITNGRYATAFQLSDPCMCHQTSAILHNIYSLCSSILVEPCQCTADSCKCQEPFIGNGEYCTIDSDSDGFPDKKIDILCSNGSIAMLNNYCINDTCPDIYNPEQNPPICEAVCRENLLAGIVWKESYENDSITFKCSEISNKFSDSIFVTFSRECAGASWFAPSFASCTLSDTATNKPFIIVDVTLVADNTSIVLSKEAAILIEVINFPEMDQLLADLADYDPEISITKYIEYTLGIGVVIEVTFNTYDQDHHSFTKTLQNFQEIFYEFSGPIGGFQQAMIANGRYATAFQLSDPCMCHQTSAILHNIYSLCSSILVEPCQCTADSCKCQEPFIGNGEYCTIDSDSDGFPDKKIDILCSNGSIAMLNNYCINDTCPDIYNPEQNPPICEAVFAGCLEEKDDYYGIHWPETPIDTTYRTSCGDGNVIGLATRHCDSNGDWLSINDAECESRNFNEISTLSTMNFVENPSSLNNSELQALTIFSQELIGKLASATNASLDQSKSLFPKDLSTSNEAISGALSVFLENVQRNKTGEVVSETSNLDFGIVFSNLLDSSNQHGWSNLQMINPAMGSELLLKNSESFGSFLSSTANETQDVVISTRNIVFHAKIVTAKPNSAVPEDIIFPESTDLENFVYQETTAAIILSGNLFSEAINGTSISVVHTLFNNLQSFIFSSVGKLGPGTLILSSQTKIPIPLSAFQTDPINIKFKIITDNFSNPNCAFWNFSNPIGDGSWSTVDIETVSNGSSVVSCLSEHLTSFAVLVDTRGITEEIPQKEALGLSAVTYVGLSVSTVCLVITVVFFLTYGKALFTNVHFFVHLNFGLSLLLSNIVFITGIETANENKIACTVVAALLHYLYLSVFCWMLCEGIMMYLMLVLVFSRISKKWWMFMLIGWAAPLLPVVITVGASYDNYTAGTTFCWLSASHNVIWGFVAPVILIIVINVFFYVRILYVLLKNRSKYYNKENKGGAVVISTLKGSIILLPLLGLMWAFGFLAVNQNTTLFAWIFTILNSFQGVAFFVLHVIRNERVLKYFTIEHWKRRSSIAPNNDKEIFSNKALNTDKVNDIPDHTKSEIPLISEEDNTKMLEMDHESRLERGSSEESVADQECVRIEKRQLISKQLQTRTSFDHGVYVKELVDTEDITFV